MNQHKLERLLYESPFLLLGSLFVFYTDPILGNAFNNAIQNSPSTVAPLWGVLAVIFSFHLDLVGVWSVWILAVIAAIEE